ncbi:PilZ domain-containing protein [Eleftheria terrae]|uniref:PilZ domain-containing protein n=1 Tax=Eleftheria terrae TaxID=1597781 RepID=UPI00263B1FC6|nr:PilZ domain-containing protein [Eleftheria terrae]WKB50842.1 PilZ domain-containing protein [Eleftheria terrae]
MRLTLSIDERRASARKVLRVPAVVQLAAGDRLEGRALDVSSGGVSIAVSKNPRVSTQCKLFFTLPLEGSLHAINCQAVVVHAILSNELGFKVGLKINEITAESKAKLERYLRR